MSTSLDRAEGEIIVKYKNVIINTIKNINGIISSKSLVSNDSPYSNKLGNPIAPIISPKPENLKLTSSPESK